MHTRSARLAFGALIAIMIPVAGVYVYKTEDRLCYAPASMPLGSAYRRDY